MLLKIELENFFSIKNRIFLDFIADYEQLQTGKRFILQCH